MQQPQTSTESSTFDRILLFFLKEEEEVKQKPVERPKKKEIAAWQRERERETLWWLPIAELHGVAWSLKQCI